MPHRSSQPKLGLVFLVHLAFVGTTSSFNAGIAPGSSRHTNRLILDRWDTRRTPTRIFLASPRSSGHDNDDVTANQPIVSFTNDQQVTAENFQSGFLVLLSVPLAWGTFEPAVRFVYEVAPQIPTVVFLVAYYAVAAMGLLTLLILERQRTHDDISALTGVDDETTTTTSQKFLWGGMELGTYLFVGNALQVLGLRTTPSDRAAFIL